MCSCVIHSFLLKKLLLLAMETFYPFFNCDVHSIINNLNTGYISVVVNLPLLASYYKYLWWAGFAGFGSDKWLVIMFKEKGGGGRGNVMVVKCQTGNIPVYLKGTLIPGLHLVLRNIFRNLFNEVNCNTCIIFVPCIWQGNVIDLINCPPGTIVT